MNKLTVLGVLLALSGMCLLIFKAIAAATKTVFPPADLSLIQFLSDEKLDYFDSLSSPTLQSCIQVVITTPLYLSLIIIGIIMAIICGMFAK